MFKGQESLLLIAWSGLPRVVGRRIRPGRLAGVRVCLWLVGEEDVETYSRYASNSVRKNAVVRWREEWRERRMKIGGWREREGQGRGQTETEAEG